MATSNPGSLDLSSLSIPSIIKHPSFNFPTFFYPPLAASSDPLHNHFLLIILEYGRQSSRNCFSFYFIYFSWTFSFTGHLCIWCINSNLQPWPLSWLADPYLDFPLNHSTQYTQSRTFLFFLLKYDSVSAFTLGDRNFTGSLLPPRLGSTNKHRANWLNLHTMLRALKIVSHLILTANLCGKYSHHLHITTRKREPGKVKTLAQRHLEVNGGVQSKLSSLFP